MPDDGTERLVELARLVQQTGYHFVTPTPATHARVNARADARVARSVRDVFGWSRPFEDGIVPDRIMRAMQAAGVLEPCGNLWRSGVRLSSLDGLLFLHSAFPTTQPDSVFFGPDTYRFAQALAEATPRSVRRAVDIGCGSGAGAVLLATAQPNAEILGVDINPTALRFTRASAALAGVPVKAAISDVLGGVAGQFDLIVANPPYLVDAAERAYRHGGGPCGAALSLSIVDAALERLEPGGSLILYTGAVVVNGIDTFYEAVALRLQESASNWRYRELDPDVFGEELDLGPYARADRISAICLTMRKN